MSFTWRSSFDTGIEIIDLQHRRIVDYINQLEGAIGSQDRYFVGLVLDELVDYTLSHLAFEEALQEEARYSMAVPHKAVHDQFARRVEKYRQRHDAGEDVGAQVHGMLYSWLVHHIQRDDMAYVPEVKAALAARLMDRREASWMDRMLGRFFPVAKLA
ncbi:MAG: bacteriohemerythrin [Pseudomonadota bacterium]